MNRNTISLKQTQMSNMLFLYITTHLEKKLVYNTAALARNIVNGSRITDDTKLLKINTYSTPAGDYATAIEARRLKWHFYTAFSHGSTSEVSHYDYSIQNEEDQSTEIIFSGSSF